MPCVTRLVSPERRGPTSAGTDESVGFRTTPLQHLYTVYTYWWYCRERCGYNWEHTLVVITGNIHVRERTRMLTGVAVGVFLGGVDESIRFWE